MNLFEKTTYIDIKNKAQLAFEKSFDEFIDTYRNEIHLTNVISILLKNEKLIKSNYELGLYFLSECYKLASFYEPMIDLEEGNVEVSEVEEFLFEELTETQYGSDFLKLIDSGMTKIDAIEQTLELFSDQLELAYDKHFESKTDANYREISELADEFENKENYLIDEYKIHLFSKNFNEQSIRIKNALKNIKSFSPDSFIRFSEFTRYITELNDEGLVSYSSQYLPHYSAINLYHRDDLDLMDDLLHENGHHHMNYYLNHVELINEDDELIYYSPWRKALRPIRGIYHAVWTFYFAFKLYHDLLNSEFFNNSNQESKQKIVRRFLEERDMILFCEEDLEHAYKNGKVTDEGKAHIDEILSLVKKQGQHISEKQKAIAPDMSELSETLDKFKKMKAY